MKRLGSVARRCTCRTERRASTRQALSEAAASLLPDGPRPAVVFHVRIGPDGQSKLDGAERSLIRQQGQARVRDGAARATCRTTFPSCRGASPWPKPPVAPPASNRSSRKCTPPKGGGYDISFRPRLQSEDDNAAMSLATNLAIADALYAAGIGLFRVMPEPDERTVQRLRHTARAFGIEWPADMDLREFERSLNSKDPKHGAMLMAIRRAGGRASYVSFRQRERPWHAAVAATYAHATAPLRRLADRYVVMAALAVANGQPVPDQISAAFHRLPDVMRRAEDNAGQIERAVIDLAEVASAQCADTALVQRGGHRCRRSWRAHPVVRSSRRFTHFGSKVTPGDEVRVRVSVDRHSRSCREARTGGLTISPQ